MAADLAKLKAELLTDPLGRGYAGMTDEQAAKSLNKPDRPGVPREAIDGGLLASCLVRTEYAALNAADKEYVRLLCATATPIPLTAHFKGELRDVFGANTGMRTKLMDAIKRSGTRAEELELGGTVTPSDVADAKRLP